MKIILCMIISVFFFLFLFSHKKVKTLEHEVILLQQENKELKYYLEVCCVDNDTKDSVIAMLYDPLVRMKLIFNVHPDSNLTHADKLAMGSINMQRYFSDLSD